MLMWRKCGSQKGNGLRQALTGILDVRRVAWPWLFVIIGIALLIITPMFLYAATPTLDWIDYPAVTPSSPETSRQAFAIAFWPSLYSGMIAGVITGLLIGVALWMAQLRVAALQERRRQLDAISGFFGNVERFARLTSRQHYVPVTAHDAIPEGVLKIERESEGLPLNVWWDLFPKAREPLHHLWVVRQASMDLDQRAGLVDEMFEISARRFLGANGYDIYDEDVDAIRRYSIGRVFGVESQILVDATVRDLGSEELANAYDFAMQRPEAEGLIAGYRAMLGAAKFALEALGPLSPAGSIPSDTDDGELDSGSDDPSGVRHDDH